MQMITRFVNLRYVSFVNLHWNMAVIDGMRCDILIIIEDIFLNFMAFN